MKTEDVLLAPVVTERATLARERHSVISFKVALAANKHMIRQAVESAYEVQVASVRTAIVRGKVKRRGKSIGKRPNWKKAMVALAQGGTIDFFATE